MKTSAIVCAVLAGTFGLSSIASAQMLGQRDNGSRSEQRDRRDDRRQATRDKRQDWRANDRQRNYQQPRQYTDQQPRHYTYQQPRHHGYQQPAYRMGPRFSRGSYLPHEYRQRPYYVSNWQAHRNLYAPPYGHQWINVDGEFLLVALATGLIANALLN